MCPASVRWCGLLASLAIGVIAGVVSSTGGIASAQEGATLGALCGALRAEAREADLGPAVCRVLARARTAGTSAALLRVSDARADELVIAVHGGDGWRVVGRAGAAYNFQDARGEIELGAFAVRQVIPGGRDEVEVTVRRWQSVLEPPSACSASRQREVHRHVCTEHEGAWRCAGLQIEALAGDVVVVERPCRPPPSAPAPAWAVALRFTDRAVEVEHRSGTLPAMMQAWLGARPLDDFFDPARRPPSPLDAL